MGSRAGHHPAGPDTAVTGPVRRRPAAALGRLVRTAAAAGAARSLLAALSASPLGHSSSWRRPNHRGQPVSLLEGPAVVLAGALATTTAARLPPRLRLAALAAGVGSAAVGRFDDMYGRGEVRGLRGHVAALGRGRLSTGVAKVVGIGGSGLVAAALARPSGRAKDPVLAGAVVAGTANLVNLFDLRPGRAIKGALLVGLPVWAAPGSGGLLLAAPLGAAVGVLPADLGERTMLGDAGANGLGALLGLGLVTGASRLRLGVLALVLTALTVTSEVVSFSVLVERVPALRQLDHLGRRSPG